MICPGTLAAPARRNDGVELSEREQQCCGDPCRVGSTVTWKLVARGPSNNHGRPASRYREEHHGETPEHVPHLLVTGTVRYIDALHYAFDEGPNRVSSPYDPAVK